MELIKRIAISVRPEDAFIVGGFYSLDYTFGASNQSTIRYGYVALKPKHGFDWLEIGDKVWFTQTLSDAQGFDSDGITRSCIIFPQEDGELCGITEERALLSILGIERDGKLFSSPKYLACSPITEQEEVKRILMPDIAKKESETMALCIEDEEDYNDGDIIYFRKDSDYPAAEMKSEWVKRNGKRVIFLQKEFIYGKEVNGEFIGNDNWAVLRALDEGDIYKSTKSGIYVLRTDAKEIKGDAELVFDYRDLKKGTKVKHSKRGFNRFKLGDEELYVTEEELLQATYE